MNAAAWFLAVIVMFGPGIVMGWAVIRRRRQHRKLRAFLAAYSHIPPRRR